MKLSVILTVYNEEPFLRKALEALLNQKEVQEGEYEVLAINDGSTDGSAAILEEYAKKDKRIRLVFQENQGLSVARNNGTDKALGDYVWYVDADDTISTQAVRFICDAISTRPDVIPIYAETEGEKGVRNQIPKICKTGKDILLSGKWQPCGVFNVFRRSFLKVNKLRFLPGIYHEDSEFTPRVLYLAKTVSVVPEVLYTVIHEPNSITQVPRAKRAFDYLIVADNLYQFIVENGELETEIGRVFCNRISAAVNNALSVIIRNNKQEQDSFNKELKNKAYLIKAMRKSTIRKYRIESFLFCVFPGHYVTINKVLKYFK